MTATAEAHELRVTIIQPRTRWRAIDLAPLWRFRELLLTLAWRDLKLRYKQTALGVIWVVLQPLLAATIFSFVFGRVARLSSEGLPYMVFSFAGMLVWNLFSGTLTKASTSLVANSQLIRKVFFPRLILPLSAVPSSLVDFVIGLLMMTGMMAIHGIRPGWAMLTLPFSIAVVLMMSVGAGLLTGALAVGYRDIQHINPVAVQILLYASPIAYSVTAVPAELRWLYRLNPLSAPFEAFRSSLLGTVAPPWEAFAYSVVVSLLVLAAGLYTFGVMERKFADVI